MMNHHRTNDYRTPRTLQQGFGPYAEWHRPKKRDSRWWYVAAAGVMVEIVFMLCR